MKIITAALGAAAALALPAAANAAVTYLPIGPQANVNIATVTGGGWTLCYSATMAQPFGNSAATTLAGCTGDRLLLAGRETGSSNLMALAQTTKLDALFDTGAADNNVFHTADGSDWFYSDSWSWGFKEIGASFTKFQCDFSPPAGASMCLHTFDFTGGFSINQVVGLNGSPNYEKLVFMANGVVPEPSAWALMILGFGAVGAALRGSRRRRVALSYV